MAVKRIERWQTVGLTWAGERIPSYWDSAHELSAAMRKILKLGAG